MFWVMTALMSPICSSLAMARWAGLGLTSLREPNLAAKSLQDSRGFL